MAKFKKIAVRGVQSHLKFLKIQDGSAPHVQNFWQKLKKFGRLKMFSEVTNIKVAHKPFRAISDTFKTPEDKIEKEASRGIVYDIKSKDCDCVYVGQTSCALKTSQCQVLVKRTPYRGDIFRLILLR